jgi:hypothetical protein
MAETAAGVDNVDEIVWAQSFTFCHLGSITARYSPFFWITLW